MKAKRVHSLSGCSGALFFRETADSNLRWEAESEARWLAYL